MRGIWRFGAAAVCATFVCGIAVSCVRVPDPDDPVTQSISIESIVKRVKCDLFDAVKGPLKHKDKFFWLETWTVQVQLDVAFSLSLQEIKDKLESGTASDICHFEDGIDLNSELKLREWLDKSLQPVTDGVLTVGYHPAPKGAVSAKGKAPTASGAGGAGFREPKPDPDVDKAAATLMEMETKIKEFAENKDNAGKPLSSDILSTIKRLTDQVSDNIKTINDKYLKCTTRHGGIPHAFN